MKVVIFGASGMVGQGVLLECLRDPGVEQVLVIGRTSVGRSDPKLREILTPDLFEVSTCANELHGLDACFYTLGVTSIGMQEDAYRRLTYDLTLQIAKALAAQNPALTFVYVSGSGTDSTVRGRVMWARIKGATESALQRLSFRNVFLFRPGFIQPLDGIRSKTRLYQSFLTVGRPFLSLLHRVFPLSIVTTREVGRAMLHVARNGWKQPVLEAKDIHAAATRPA